MQQKSWRAGGLVAHIAFFTIPGAGHVNPTVGLVAELVARGHRVSYAVTAEHGGEVSRVGARLVPYRTAMGEFRATMTNLSDPDRFTADDFAQVLRALALETETVLPQLVDALAGDRPDLVVYDGLSGWSGRLLAACWGAPAVRCIPTFAANEHWSLGADGKYAAFEEHNAALAAAFEEVGAMFERIGSPIPASEFFGTSESGPALVFLPREFQYAGETFGSDFHFVGPCLDER
ncbi:glycosyltransferase, partial [Streptomyces sp. NPDC090021]